MSAMTRCDGCGQEQLRDTEDRDWYRLQRRDPTATLFDAKWFAQVKDFCSLGCVAVFATNEELAAKEAHG